MMSHSGSLLALCLLSVYGTALAAGGQPPLPLEDVIKFPAQAVAQDKAVELVLPPLPLALWRAAAVWTMLVLALGVMPQSLMALCYFSIKAL